MVLAKHIKLRTDRLPFWTAIIFAPGNEKHDFTWKSNGRICQNVIDISVGAGKVWGNLIYFPWPPIRLKSVVPLLLTSPRSFRGVDAEPDPSRGRERRENGVRVG